MSSVSDNTQHDTSPLAHINIPEWDKGTFAQELVNRALLPRPLPLSPKGSPTSPTTSLPPISSGTFDGSQKAATEMFRRIKERYVLIPSWRCGARNIILGFDG
jgi:hypothetical protein